MNLNGRNTRANHGKIALRGIAFAKVANHLLVMDNMYATTGQAAIDPSHPAVVLIDVVIRVVVKIDSVAQVPGDEYNERGQVQAGPRISGDIKAVVPDTPAGDRRQDRFEYAGVTHQPPAKTALGMAWRPIEKPDGPDLLQCRTYHLCEYGHSGDRGRRWPQHPQFCLALTTGGGILHRPTGTCVSDEFNYDCRSGVWRTME
jgi:hypothetical protein